MNLAGEMQHCMVTLDVSRAMQIWRRVAPHLPPITSEVEMLKTLHLARTQSEALSKRLRFYSHRWLSERALPSALPDHMRQSAERMYPSAEKSVGISVNARSPIFRPVMTQVRDSMEEAVLEVYSDGQSENIDLIRRRMMEARRGTVKRLLGV